MVEWIPPFGARGQRWLSHKDMARDIHDFLGFCGGGIVIFDIVDGLM
jgi:hypothetical protein